MSGHHYRLEDFGWVYETLIQLNQDHGKSSKTFQFTQLSSSFAQDFCWFMAKNLFRYGEIRSFADILMLIFHNLNYEIMFDSGIVRPLQSSCHPSW